MINGKLKLRFVQVLMTRDVNELKFKTDFLQSSFGSETEFKQPFSENRFTISLEKF
jgi:hypothetical protein